MLQTTWPATKEITVGFVFCRVWFYLAKICKHIVKFATGEFVCSVAYACGVEISNTKICLRHLG